MATQTVGKPIAQVTAREKVLGRSIYAGDIKRPGMIHAKILRSPHSHARILSIDTSAAEALPGVYCVATGYDVPTVKWGVAHKQQTILASNVVRFIGEEVAAVAAETEDAAQAALDLIFVEYEEMPALYEADEALSETAPQVHDEGNLAHEILIARGDVEAGFADADLVYEEEYFTHSQYPGYLEPMATVAETDGMGRLTIWTSTQSIFLARDRFAKALNRPVSTIRVVQPSVGGGFGGKIVEERSSLIAAFLATRVDRPVRLGLNRLEDMQSCCFSVPARLRLKMGMTKDGRITAKEVSVLAECGAYAGLAPEVMLVTAMRSDNMQRIENVSTVAQLVYTNTIPRGAFRGFGGAQMSFALNSHLTTMAGMLGIDPFDLHGKNAIRSGDVSIHGWQVGSSGLSDCLDLVREQICWDDRCSRPAPTGAIRSGVGMAAAMHVSGNRTMGNWDGSTVVLKVNEDGRAMIMTAESDMGQGANTMLTQLCSEVLGIPVEHISVHAPDTDHSPYCLGSIASRVTVNAGNAMIKAAQQAREQILSAAADMLECATTDLTIEDGEVLKEGPGNLFATLPEICRHHIYRHGGEGILVRATHDPQTVMMDSNHYGNIAPAYSFAAQAVKVEVDTETGEVRVIDSFLADDCGKAINPMSVHGQSNGAAVQAIGWTLFEDARVEYGNVLNANFADYVMPTADAVPALNSAIVECPDPNGPMGAKGASETAILPGAPAIANAIFDAIGVRITELPITPEKILAGLAEQKEATHA